MKLAGLGDSNTWGYPFGPHHSWLQGVANKLSCQVFNHGINGECVYDMRLRVPAVAQDQPDAIIIMGGTNDAFEGIALAELQREYRAIIDELTVLTSCRILIGLPIPLNHKVEELLAKEYREWMKSFALEQKIEVIDFYSALLDSSTGGIRSEYNLDGVHPNQQGFERMAEEAVNTLLRKI
ncbi:GDSL-type esterase/lipase family protein [Ammoniphilus sp. YIM 78166]|uniref:GDSL-type esterase/lipase family protein n=1 Tax=Ammoniphilus sp. YIM 78166 TaxID=1644106 RepID=UPI00143164AD|nr:GDSL-type esterase/lipase family protein [Ammoniphilus sp. YIM 78166]